MAAALPDTRADPCAALPHTLALRLFGDLTLEERLRCREVCRGWSATLADHTLWLRLDLTRADGAACSEALLRAATARAGGQLQALRLTCAVYNTFEALLSVAAANNTTLQELRVHANAPHTSLRVANLRALLCAAPQLHMLEADVYAFNMDEAHQLLRNNPPFGPLRVRQFAMQPRDGDTVPLTADVAAHVWLTGLHLRFAHLNDRPALDAVVDAALARRLSAVQLHDSHLSPASAPALVRLLAGNALLELSIGNGLRLLDEPAASLLGDALRANTSLTALHLSFCHLWERPAAGNALCAALAGHPRLRTIDLSYNSVGGNIKADERAALGVIVAANSPALQLVDVRSNWLGDAGMSPLVEALRHNTHLTKLDCGGNRMSEAFARDRLLPAVRANASLRKLIVAESGTPHCAAESAHEAAALVAARAQQSRIASAE
jgi:hypothetical protein